MLDKLSQIKVYSFVMKDDPAEKIEFGVMAQELEPILPELVKTASDAAGTKSVNYVGLIAPVIEGINEQQTQNELQQDQVNQQQAEIVALKEEIKKLHDY